MDWYIDWTRFTEVIAFDLFIVGIVLLIVGALRRHRVKPKDSERQNGHSP